MSNPLDTDAGSEMFGSYENELKLVQADLNQKLDQITEASGEERKNAIRQAEQVLDEATELVSPSSTAADRLSPASTPHHHLHAPRLENEADH
jgi:vesicle transport through interaction with t-SNAREs protein 1